MSVRFVFHQVDDSATITVNGHAYPSQGLIQHNQPKAVVDITNSLREGANKIEIVAKNGPAWAVFRASLMNNDEVIEQWHAVMSHAPQNDVFFNEVFHFHVIGGQAIHPSGAGYWVVVNQVDDHLELILNEGTPHHKKLSNVNLIHHNNPAQTINLTPHMQHGENTLSMKLYNGLGHGVLKGGIKVGEAASTAEFMEEWDYADANAPKNNYILEETYHLTLE